MPTITFFSLLLVGPLLLKALAAQPSSDSFALSVLLALLGSLVCLREARPDTVPPAPVRRAGAQASAGPSDSTPSARTVVVFPMF